MANVAIVVGMLLCLALGWIVGDWQRGSDVIAALELAGQRDGKALAAQLGTERRLVAAEAARNARRARVVDVVASTPQLADCPLPPELVRLLDDQAAATRRPRLPAGEVP